MYVCECAHCNIHVFEIELRTFTHEDIIIIVYMYMIGSGLGPGQVWIDYSLVFDVACNSTQTTPTHPLRLKYVV
jgi:hypothetical protein